MTPTEGAVPALAVTLVVVVRTSAPLYASPAGGFLTTRALLSVAAVVLHRCGG
jgi:hypothetical protein